VTSYTSNWIFLGNFADFDTSEHNNAVEDRGDLIGTTFDTANNPDMQLLAATYDDPNGDGSFETNNTGGTGDLVSYDSGSGSTSSRIDSHWDYNADIVLSDGSTVARSIGMVQLENGDLFINGDNLDGLEIVSITPTSVAHTGYGSWWGERDIENSSVVCFAAGTLITTESGAVAVQALRVGDKVMTVDRGLQVVRWVGCRRIPAADVAANPALVPVTIRAGALGRGLPKRDLHVSQQHRMLVRSKIANRMFGAQEVLVAAKFLVGLPGITFADNQQDVVYCHFLCDQHEVVIAEGAQTESLFTGPEAIKTLPQEARREIFTIFPDLFTAEEAPQPQSARPLVKGKVARNMVARHKRNDRLVFATNSV